MKPLYVAVAIGLPCVVVGGASSPARADVSIADNNKTINVDCAKDQNISVMGNHITINTTGVCTSLTIAGNECSFTGSVMSASVPGNHNTITLTAVDDVSVQGNYNTVFVKRPIKSKKPSVSNIGNHNKVQ
jgi:hypothetical protein